MPRGERNWEWRWSGLQTLGPGVGIRFDDVLADVFDLEPDAFGSLVIEASSEDVLAMGRIFTSMDGKASGTYGQAVPAERIGDFVAAGERRRILFGTENAEMRFNVGCQSTYEWDEAIHIELFDAAGNSLETRTMTLPPWGNDQLNRIFGAHRPIIGAVDVWTEHFGGMFTCYGSVLDNQTNDPTTIPPQ